MKKQWLLIIGVLMLSAGLSQNAMAERAAISSQSHGEYADEPEEHSEEGTFAGQTSGSFDGYDLKKRIVWIGDMRYELYPGFKVINKRSKKSSLEAIPAGEEVSFVTKPNRNNPATPYVLEIRRH